MTKKAAVALIKRTSIELYEKTPVWIDGTGNFAVWAECRDVSVSLHKTMEDAERAKARIDATGCGGACSVKRKPDAHWIDDLTEE